MRSHRALVAVVMVANGFKVGFSDPRVDDLFLRQSRALDPCRAQESHQVKNYIAPPNHDSNQKLQDVWLSED